MNTLSTLTVVLVLLADCKGQSNNNPLESKPVSHELLDSFLKKYISAQGLVNYEAIQQNKQELEACLAVLEKNHPNDWWSKNEKMAYWINAYNWNLNE